MTEESSDRKFERAVSNILPYRAISTKSPIVFEPVYSDPFVISEVIAVRDHPNFPFYLAKVTSVTDSGISVQYFG